MFDEILDFQISDNFSYVDRYVDCTIHNFLYVDLYVDRTIHIFSYVDVAGGRMSNLNGSYDSLCLWNDET